MSVWKAGAVQSEDPPTFEFIYTMTQLAVIFYLMLLVKRKVLT